MVKQQAEQIAKQYVESQRGQFGPVKQDAIDKAVRRVAGALQAITKSK